jgi:hypothetical protein
MVRVCEWAGIPGALGAPAPPLSTGAAPPPFLPSACALRQPLRRVSRAQPFCELARPPLSSRAARNLNNIEDGFYISPAFLDKLSIHVAKNFLDLPKIKVPLILGIWGGKGQGKTFQCNLAYKVGGPGAPAAANLCAPGRRLACRTFAAPCENGVGCTPPATTTGGIPPRVSLRPRRSWASPPSSCRPASWRAATRASPPS